MFEHRPLVTPNCSYFLTIKSDYDDGLRIFGGFAD
uniref:Uncharacterized protein n=1 Tax=Rhizophora mucronata TaxID=61149 RepID=A0A2P2LIE3_RHIMU